MEKQFLTLGGIYRANWNNDPIRIIGFDQIEVLYDCLLGYNGRWMFSGNFKRKSYFYRTSAPFFEKTCKRVDFLSLTQEEEFFFAARPANKVREIEIIELE